MGQVIFSWPLLLEAALRCIADDMANCTLRFPH